MPILAENVNQYIKKERREMNKYMLKIALWRRKVFKVGNSFIFAAQIPDDSVGISGSRCSNCNGKVAYCDQRCKYCGLPFIGPFGFPQIAEWKALSLGEQRAMVEHIYAHHNKRGRLGYAGVMFVPLTVEELWEVEKMKDGTALTFTHIYGISPQKIRKTLLT